jgi:NADH/F420H2 dehydrogenase subunit C
MTNEEIKAHLAALNSNAVVDETSRWLNVTVPVTEWKNFAESLRYEPALHFDYLFCLTAVDWKTHLSVVYHLESTEHRHIIVVKVNTGNTVDAHVPSVSDIWRTAEFHEREAYDLMGIQFDDHPDLRRLFLTEDWEGFPLRKDYSDPVNMIKL